MVIWILIQQFFIAAFNIFFNFLIHYEEVYVVYIIYYRPEKTGLLPTLLTQILST